jgi:hypothetical protein
LGKENGTIKETTIHGFGAEIKVKLIFLFEHINDNKKYRKYNEVMLPCSTANRSRQQPLFKWAKDQKNMKVLSWSHHVRQVEWDAQYSEY